MLDLVLRMLKDLYGISMTWLLENKKMSSNCQEL